MPSPRLSSSRRAAVLSALAFGGLLVLVARPDVVVAGARHARLVARADTDSVSTSPWAPALSDTTGLDSMAADTTDADTLDVDSTARARTYFPTPVEGEWRATVAPPWAPGLRGRLGQYWRREVTLDTTSYTYRVRESVGENEVRAPSQLTLDEFLEARRTEALGDQFRTLAAQRSDRQQRRRGGVSFAVDIPGGEQSAFRTLFGKNEVALTVNGTSNVNLGIRYDQSDLQQALSPGGNEFAPDFGQELNLNVAGTIGDKLAINVNYDTGSQFDFENQVSLVYTGYEDDIVQRIEAGNVFLQTPATLIRGGQRLFGLRTDLQFGPLALTAVASQQDAETVDRVFEGGSDAQEFRLAPYEYEDRTHFFVGFAFHNWWDRAHERPQNPQLPPGLARFVGIEVWKHEPGLINASTEDIETTWAVALADLGEITRGSARFNEVGVSVLEGGEAYLGTYDEGTGRYSNEAAFLPDPALDQYPDDVLNGVRQNGATATATTIVPATGGEPLPPTGAFSNNVFKRLRANVDYTFDDQLGWLSLTTSLTESDLLAVAYQYETTDGRLVTVGDYGRPAQSSSQTGPRTILKLLRADRQTPDNPLWDLTLRNIYRVGGRSLTESTFDLDVTYEPSGTSASSLPPSGEVSFEQQTFLTVLGLDRVNGQGQATPDNTFDFRSGVTINPDAGRVIFPVRQPFGDYLIHLIRDQWTVGTIGAGGRAINVTYGSLTPDVAVARYVPTYDDGSDEGATLYDLEPSNARQRIGRLGDYRIEGEFRSSTQSVFNIGFQLVEGTVRVTAGDRDLDEGTDYRVNYTSGTVEITNPIYLQEGQRIRVSVEQNKFFSIGSKTLLGLRADYRISEDFGLGATWMRLAERPLGDKFRIGEEALSNTILGFDGSFVTEPRWLTRAIDALPLIQTRAPSRLDIRGEVARLNPGTPETFAFGRARDALREAGLDFADDELSGISYIDDFEGSENAYTALSYLAGWRIAAPPDGAGPTGAISGDASSTVTDPRLQTNWRGLFTWYSIGEAGFRALEKAFGADRTQRLFSRATAPVQAGDLYSERDFGGTKEARRSLELLDLYFDPTRRGPYNFNGELSTTFAQNPRDVWGGFIRAIESSYSNFDGQNNIEFVEILYSPLGGPNGDQPVTDGATMYLDLGRLNEDVLPNGFLNSEDGLSLQSNEAPPIDGQVRDNWGIRPTSRTDGLVNTINETGRTEDLGIDGLPSQSTLGPATYPLSEQDQFRSFLNTLPDGPELNRSGLDPSADDYHYFLDPQFDDTSRYPATADGATLQERYANYYPAFEINSALAQQNLVENGQGVAVTPNTEDVNGNNTLDRAESFHRYEIPLTDAAIRASPFFLNTLETFETTGNPQTWYLLRIPVRTQNKESIGIDDDDFSRVEAARVWTTGHDRPVTIRVASFELVGSQWLKSEAVGFVSETGDTPGASGEPAPALFIESINNEENDAIYALPRGTLQNTSRELTGQLRATREQALVFRAEGLAAGRRTGIVRSYTTNPHDLTKYSNLRLHIHGDGFDRADSMRVFVRFGDDETENYYELEQPLYPFDIRDLASLPECLSATPFNCARSDSLWQTNVGGIPGNDLNPINIVLSELNRAKLERDRDGADIGTRYTITDPEGTPPGATITVRGQPSIQDVRTIVLGVRNGGGRTIDTVSVWFNELRVTGYDEAGGASGFFTANATLADLATINARLSFTQDGFGDLGGALGGRSFASQTAFTLTSSFNANKLLPERFGWRIPISYSITQNGSTPRYDPDNGDVRLDDLVEQARTAEDDGSRLPADQRADAILARARTQTSSRNFRVQATKTGSRSPWLRYTVDGLTAAYAASAQTGSNPSNQVSDSDSWTGSVSYRVAPPKPLTVTPFWFTRPVPLLGSVLGGVQLNLLPQNVVLSTDASRRVSATQPRLGTQFLAEPDSVSQFRVLTRRNQQFDHGRTVDVRYQPLPYFQFSFATDTKQDLGAAGQRESYRILVRERDGGFSRIYNLSPTEARDTTGLVYQDLLSELDGFSGGGFPNDRIEILGGSNLEVLPLTEALGNAFRGDLRTRSYGQRVTASLRVSTQRLAWLRWIQLQPVSVSADYNWQDQPTATAPDLEVASAGTTASLQSSVKVQPRTFFRLFPFYRGWEQAAGRGQGSRQPRTTQPADSSARGFSPFRLARDAFLAVTSVDDITVTYRSSSRVAASGIDGGAFSLFSAFSGAAPPLAYRLGLDRSLGIENRITSDAAFNQFSDLLATQHDIDARTQLSPFRGLSVGLNWRTGWSSNEETDFLIPPGGGSVNESLGRRTGGGESTVFAFGGSYLDAVQSHADRFLKDTAGLSPNTTGDPTVVDSEFLSPTGLADDFSAELARGFGSFGPNGLFPFPLPNWTVTYSGLERLPLLRKLANQISLQHGYSATSQTQFATLFDTSARDYDFGGFSFTGAAALAESGYDEPTSVSVNERFQPLIGLTFGFKGGIQASLSTNRTSVYTLQAASAQIYQKTAQDLRVDFSYARTGLRLFGLRGVNNNIRFQLTALVSSDETSTRPFQNDVLATIRGEPLTELAPQATGRLQVSPRISYTISNQVTADLFGEYTRTSTDLAGNTNRFNGGVLLRILFSN